MSVGHSLARRFKGRKSPPSLSVMVVRTLQPTVYVLAMVGHLKNVCLTFAQMPDRITTVGFTTVSPTIANTMLADVFRLSTVKMFVFSLFQVMLRLFV